MQAMRDSIFISYSHKDHKFLEELQTMLEPLQTSGIVDRWDDTRIPAGAQWRDEIVNALNNAKAAVLLVSTNFLASKFIANYELPSLLKVAKEDGLTVYWVCLDPCLYEVSDIEPFQSFSDPSKCLGDMKLNARKRVWKKLSQALVNIPPIDKTDKKGSSPHSLSPSSPGIGAMGILDGAKRNLSGMAVPKNGNAGEFSSSNNAESEWAKIGINLMVEVFVPHQGGEGKTGEIVVGYPMPSGCILTVYHALHPKEFSRDENLPVKVRWHHPSVALDWQPVDGIAWESERWNLALLDCHPPTGVSRWGCLISENRPTNGMQWVGVGFPSLAGPDIVRQPFGIGGVVVSDREAADLFQLDAATGPSEGDWRGVLGSPVVIYGRILGMIVDVPNGLGSNRLQAVPIWKVLREEEGFCEKAGQRNRQKRRDTMRRRVEQQLQSATAAVIALAGELPDADVVLRKPRGPVDVPDLVERLLNLEVDRLISVCKAAHKSLVGTYDAVPISELVQTILPAIYDHGVVESVKCACGDVAVALLTLPAHYPTVAEIIMAGVDGRETSFCERRRDDEFPKGKLCLPEPPECGFDADGMETIKALDAHLRKFSWQAAEAFSSDVDKFMVKRFPGPLPGDQQPSWERRIQVAAREIRYQAMNGQTHYLIVSKPQTGQDGAILENTLAAIRKRYPGLMCLSLDASDEAEGADFESFRPLLDLLPKTQRNP